MDTTPGSPAGPVGTANCASCGTPLAPGAAFCPHCGAVVTPVTPGANWPTGPVAYPPPAAAPGGASWPTGPAAPPASADAWQQTPTPTPYAAPGAAWPTGPATAPVPPNPATPWTTGPTSYASPDWGATATQPGIGAGAAWPGGATPPMGGQPGGPWSTTMPGAPLPAGMVGLAGTPVAPPPAPPKSHRGLIATIAAVCIVAVLGGGAYWVFAAFLNPARQLDSARYLPDSTVAFASIDLVALGTNTHHYNTSSVTFGQQGQGTPDILQSSLGLNWQTDVLPWLGRTITIAAFPGPHPDQGSTNIEGALLLQSHNDTAAAAAVNKALTHLSGQGQHFTTSSYGGYTLHVDTNGGSNSGIIATGSGLVLVTNNTDAAHAVIDRANGTGATLANTAEFQRATSDLPSGRFGTMYVNIRALANAVSPSGGTISSSILNVYPSAAASLEWTKAGMRWQTTLKAAQGGVPASSVSGDTAGLAALVPSSATVYAGAGNLGALVSSATSFLSPTGGSPSDPLQSAFGVASSDPALQQSAAVASWGKSSSNGAFLIHEASAADATQLLSRVVQKYDFTLQATTVGGVDATQITSANGSTGPFTFGAPSFNQNGTETVGVEAYINNVMVVAASTDALQSVIDTASNPSSSLAQAGSFKQLVSGAPGNAAAITYINLSTLESSLQSLLGASTSTSNPQATNSLFTLVWNNTELQLTSDVALNQ